MFISIYNCCTAFFISFSYLILFFLFLYFAVLTPAPKQIPCPTKSDSDSVNLFYNGNQYLTKCLNDQKT